MASRNMRVPRFSVYQLGRGSEPVMVVGSRMSLVPRYIVSASPNYCAISRHFDVILTVSKQQKTIAATVQTRRHAKGQGCPLGARPEASGSGFLSIYISGGGHWPFGAPLPVNKSAVARLAKSPPEPGHSAEGAVD